MKFRWRLQLGSNSNIYIYINIYVCNIYITTTTTTTQLFVEKLTRCLVFDFPAFRPSLSSSSSVTVSMSLQVKPWLLLLLLLLLRLPLPCFDLFFLLTLHHHAQEFGREKKRRWNPLFGKHHVAREEGKHINIFPSPE